MTTQQTIEAALEIAIKNGWAEGQDWLLTIRVNPGESEAQLRFAAAGIIYNHDFAKALWKDKLLRLTYSVDHFDGNSAEWHDLKLWQYHLQQMVIAPDPIAYLRDNLPS
jgi:hypothetical protein